MLKPPHHVEITDVRMEGNVCSAEDIDVLLRHLQQQARKKFVANVVGTLRFAGVITLRVDVQDRGARMRVLGKGLYPCTRSGLLNAVADVIRDDHASDPALLDVYQAMLEA